MPLNLQTARLTQRRDKVDRVIKGCQCDPRKSFGVRSEADQRAEERFEHFVVSGRDFKVKPPRNTPSKYDSSRQSQTDSSFSLWMLKLASGRDYGCDWLFVLIFGWQSWNRLGSGRSLRRTGVREGEQARTVKPLDKKFLSTTRRAFSFVGSSHLSALSNLNLIFILPPSRQLVMSRR